MFIDHITHAFHMQDLKFCPFSRSWEITFKKTNFSLFGMEMLKIKKKMDGHRLPTTH